MASKGNQPGDPSSAPIESRRTSAAPDVEGITPSGSGGVTPEESVLDEGSESVLDVPNMGEFSAEAARPTPLDDLAEVERSKLPRD